MNKCITMARQEAAAGRPTKAVAILETASADGDASASAELGLWLLAGNVIPRDVPRARTFLGQAARAGHEEAVLIEIALSANGSGSETDWASALALLHEGAKHHEYLKRELELVERLDLDQRGFPRFTPERTSLDGRLGLERFPGFLSDAECQHIANIAVHTLEPSTIVDPQSGKTFKNPIRSSEGTVIGPTQEDLVIQAIFRRIAQATGTDVTQGESLSVLRYRPGQEYKPHFDAMNGAANNRIKTVILYLNDGYAGGQTAFPELDLIVEPRAGDAIVFEGIRSDGSVNPLSCHAGLPVARGVKWIATRWIRERPYDPWTDGNRLS